MYERFAVPPSGNIAETSFWATKNLIIIIIIIMYYILFNSDNKVYIYKLQHTNDK